MKHEIKNISGAVLYTAEIPDDTPSDLAVRVALEKATRAGANLAGAHLYGAYLNGANLNGAYLAGAYLNGANLDGANLAWAYLAGAYLAGANLAGANTAGNHKLIGKRPVLTIGPIGSRTDYFTAYVTDEGTMVRAGCFFGTVAEFEAACAATHGDNKHAREYKAALALIAVHAENWKE